MRPTIRPADGGWAARFPSFFVSAASPHSYPPLLMLAVGWPTITLSCRYLNLWVTPASIQYLGLLLIPAGFALREWAIIKLGRFFSRTVQVETGHKIITDGPYRWIRHPSYTGMILIYLGIALAIGTWLGVFVTTGLVLSAILYRIYVEEQVLLEAFGSAYRDYMKRTWKLFPGW